MFRVSFFCTKKDMGEVLLRLTGLAKNLEHAYVPNVEEKKPNGRLSPTNLKVTDAVELFTKELHKLGKPTITGPEFKALVIKLRLNPTSYSHFLGNLVNAGVLKKGKKEGNAMTYHLTGK
jgi:hypothetical protein